MAEFKLTYGRPESRHDIQAETLLGSLLSVNEILTTINEEFDSGKSLEIRIQAPRRGSFEIDIEVIAEGMGVFFALGENIGYANTVVETFFGAFGLHQFLGGEPPNKVNTVDNGVQVQNENGDVIIVNNSVNHIYNGNDHVPEELSNHFGRIHQDPEIDRFAMKDDQGERFEAERSEFSRLSRVPEAEQETRSKVDTEAQVTVYKLGFERKLKWGVLYKGNKESVKITDEQFHNRINQRQEVFGKGDRLIVDMVIHQVYDEEVGDFINDSHEIIKVHRRIPRDENPDLFDDEDDTPPDESDEGL